MTIREKQSLFASLIGELIVWISEHPGWEITFGDFNRPDQHGHMGGSLHYIRLAADMNLFVDGVWKDEDCSEWQTIGAYWKRLNDLCRWGGDFEQCDLNHFSLEHNGKA